MPKIDHESVLELLDRIYSAAARETSVSDALGFFSERLGDFGASIYYHDPIIGDVSVGEITGVEPDIIHGYYNANGSDNPLFHAGIERLMSGEVVTAEELIPFEKLKETDYFKECLSLMGMRRSLAVMISGRGQRWASVATAGAEEAGDYNSSHKEFARHFQRHFARAMHILELFEEAELSRQVFQTSLELLPVGIMLATDSREVLVANSRARKLLRAIPGSRRHGKLSLGTSAHKRDQFVKWWELLNMLQTSDGACYQDDDLSPIWEVEVSRIAMTSSVQMTDQTWMVTLKEHPGDEWLSEKYLTQRYALTRKEAVVCSHLCRSGDAVSVARVMGLSPHTVRTHLKSAFAKTGTKNQTQLALKLANAGMAKLD